jgi:hypothetical protein
MRNLLIVLIFIISSSFMIREEHYSFPVIPNNFSKGEVLEFKVNFGLFTVGKAQMKMYENIYNINGRGCYKLDIHGKTSGAVDWLAKVNDNWGAYIDTAALVPHISYRNIQENNYRKKEIVKYDHDTNMVEAKVLDNKTGEFKEPEYYQAPDNVRDMIGGYLFLRAIDFKKVKVGDTLVINAFFENTFYDFSIIFHGREEVKTKAGTFRAIKLVPIMPDNKIFAGENSITLWLSDDAFKIPLKISANMFIGSAGCELVKYKGLQNEALLAKVK